SGERLFQLLPDPETGGPRVSAVALSPDGSELARGSDTDVPVKVIRIGKNNAEELSLPHGGRVFSLAFSADGKILASGGRGLKVRLWEAETGKPLGTLGDKEHHR